MSSTECDEINAKGEIVGVYGDAGGASHGYLLAGGVVTPIDFPGALMTLALGINNRSQIVGGYLDSANKEHGFLVEGF